MNLTTMLAGQITAANRSSMRLCNRVLCWSFNHGRKQHTHKGVDLQMKKTMMRKNLQKKFDLASEIPMNESEQCQIKARVSKDTPRSSSLRNKTVANLIKNELQKLADSGELGDDIQSLNLTFTKATLSSYNKCQIFWEPFLSTRDLEVADALNKGGTKFRHLLLTNMVMNNVPELQFYMDAESYRIAVVDKILQNEELDVGDSQVDENSFALPSQDKYSTVECGQAYGLDRDGILERLADARYRRSPHKT